MNVVVVVAIVALLTTILSHTTADGHALHLVSDAYGNESLLLDTTLAGTPTLFLVDTAYANAPVISTSFLGVQHECAFGSVQHRFRRGLDAMHRDRARTADGSHESLHRVLLRHGRCRSFTSGCTMRLMSIGETVENQADMLLCPALVFDGKPDRLADLNADVLVTNPLPNTPHILTIDYLLHRAPCVLKPKAQRIVFRAPPTARLGFHVHDVRTVGGAMVLPVRVAGVTLHVIVDTGASATLALAPDAVGRLSTYQRQQRHVLQVGVNGERVCSDILSATLSIGTIDLGTIDVLANSSTVPGADGYVGMGVLRALDLWIAPGQLGVRRSGLAPSSIGIASHGSCAS